MGPCFCVWQGLGWQLLLHAQARIANLRDPRRVCVRAVVRSVQQCFFFVVRRRRCRLSMGHLVAPRSRSRTRLRCHGRAATQWWIADAVFLGVRVRWHILLAHRRRL